MEINLEMIQNYNQKISESSVNRLIMNALGRVDINELAVNRDLIKSTDFTFSDELEVAPEATAQNKVGLCWAFAAMNLLRYFTQKHINVKSFEFSGTFVMFYDKLEKANYFLAKMVEYRDRPYDDRELRLLLDNPLPDGGDWFMFRNLVKKYGMVPASVMQHASYSKDSTLINKVICTKLRQDAAKIRQMAKEGLSLDQVQTAVSAYVEELYNILVVCFGTPPETFDWSYRDEDKKFHRETAITPQQFVEKYIPLDLDSYVCVWSSPMHDTPYEQLYTVKNSRQMVNGEPHLALNLPQADFKRYALKKILNHEPVLFSCDVGKDSLRKEGLLIKDIYNYDLLFQTRFGMNQADRLAMCETKMTHCMLIVGVDLDSEGNPIKWKVENSWGADVGKKGFFIMSDDWFDDNVYQIIIPKKYLSKKELGLLESEPVVLPAWHPMF